MQTLRAGCSTAEPKNFAPPQTPFPGARDSQNLTSWRWSLPLPTNPVWWGSMHAISNYRGNRPTHTHPHTRKQTGTITIHCAAASAQCNYEDHVRHSSKINHHCWSCEKLHACRCTHDVCRICEENDVVSSSRRSTEDVPSDCSTALDYYLPALSIMLMV